MKSLNPSPPKKRREKRPAGSGSARRSRNDRLALVLLALAGLLFVGLIVSGPESGERSSSSVDPGGSKRPDLSQRIERHKQEVGHKLNVERLRVEYENRKTVPRTSASSFETVPAKPDPLSYGVPMQMEQHARAGESSSRPMPNYPDAQIQQELKLDREAANWEEQARKQYIKEFIANARAAGYDVRIDKDYNVEYQRMPQSDLEDGRAPVGGGPQGGGSSSRGSTGMSR